MTSQTRESEALIGHPVGNSRFIIGEYVAGGSYGSFHYGYEQNTNKKFAVKLEKQNSPQPQLHLEYGFYRRLLRDPRFIPKVYYIGQVGEWSGLVMDLLGPSLLSMNEKCGDTFSLSTATKLMIQLVNIFEYVHDHGIVYRDIKPENFLIGLPNTDKWCTVNLIDLGFCKKYTDERNKHIPFKTGKPMTGTARYISTNNHQGREVSRRDDMEAILYMMIFLQKGELPWQGIQANGIKEKYKKIGLCKMQIQPAVLCSNMPSQYIDYFVHVRSLKFEQRPKYRHLKVLFQDVLTQLGTFLEDQIYDWDEAHNPKPTDQRS